VTQGAQEFEVRLATAGDEPDLRALVASVAMPGTVGVRFSREPDYFLGTTVMGDPCDVILARSVRDGALAGMACRAERRVYVNGAETSIGYLGQIRIASGFRGRGLVRLGAALVEGLTPPGMNYLGVIARDNAAAIGAMVGDGRPQGLRATRLAGVTSCSLVLHRGPRFRARGVRVGPVGSSAELVEVVAFLNEVGRHRQFCPVHTVADFAAGQRLRGLRHDDVLVARRAGVMVGVMAAWDQSSFKQDILDGDSPLLERIRPAWDVVVRRAGAGRLPRPGEEIPMSFGALTRVVDDDPGVARTLLSACCERARAQGKTFLMVGLADADPLLRHLRRRPHLTYRSDLYLVGFAGSSDLGLDRRPPYVDVATL
jgi:hypothetical protein